MSNDGKNNDKKKKIGPWRSKVENRGKVRQEKVIQREIEDYPLGKLTGEGKHAYRSFLLFAMQSPSKRTLGPVAKAVSRAYQTVRQYRNTWLWDKRLEHEPLADSKAQALYRKIFFDEFGVSESCIVQKNILTPISVIGNNPRGIAESVAKTLKKTEKPQSNAFTKAVKRKHLMLIDAAIGYIAAGIKTGDVRRSLRDLPLLLQLRKELTGESSKNKSGGLAIESIRVRDAKANGGDVVDALYEDALELTAILQALKSKGKSEVNIETIGEENEQHS